MPIFIGSWNDEEAAKETKKKWPETGKKVMVRGVVETKKESILQRGEQLASK